MNPQANQAKEPSLARELGINNPLKGVVSTTNVDKLSAASRQAVSMTEN